MLTLTQPAKKVIYKETKRYRRNTETDVLWLRYSLFTPSLDKTVVVAGGGGATVPKAGRKRKRKRTL